MPIVSEDGSVFMVLVGRPRDQTYVSDLKSLERAMEAARGKLTLPKASQDHRRGQYPNVSTGISYGGGSKVGDNQVLRHPHYLPATPSVLEILLLVANQTWR